MSIVNISSLFNEHENSVVLGNSSLDSKSWKHYDKSSPAIDKYTELN